MAVNNNPPISLDPSMDDGHRLTFINQNFHSLADSLSPFTLSDGNSDVLLLGKDSTGAYVLKIADTGFNAFDAADANLAFSSSRKTLQIVAQGTTSIAAVSIGAAGITSRTATVSYSNTGSSPIVLAYISGGTTSLTGGLWAGFSLVGVTVSTSAVTMTMLDVLKQSVSTTSTTFTVTGYNGSSGSFTFPSYNLTYFVLSQSL